MLAEKACEDMEKELSALKFRKSSKFTDKRVQLNA